MNSLQTYTLPVSGKGQVTIPIGVRQMLDLGKTNQVLAVVYGKKVELRSPGLSLKEIFGSVKPVKKTFRQMRRIVKAERAKRYRDEA